ncbi:hypothetical protein I4U23_022360 [Adineta vaga]|nr:hypothetical protein I4U23_022360 [Adineta vaga]
MAVDTPVDEERRNRLPIEIDENKETVQLIWLNENSNDLSDNSFIHSILLELNPAVQFYSDFDRCINLIKSIKNEQIFLIVSHNFAQRILTKISTHRNLVSIFIFPANNKQQEALVDDFDKVVGIFTDQNHLLESIRMTMDTIEGKTLIFNLFNQKQRFGRDLSKESASFVWHQMLIYILRQMPQDQQSKDEMLDICRNFYRYNRRELEKIELFRLTYTSDKAIEWYTKDCFLYKLLNKALRTEDIELLHLFRFFIIDLCSALEKECLQLKNQTNLITYRGTQILNEQLEILKQSEGKIISMNGFFSTSRDIKVSLVFAGQSQPEAIFQSVLFEIKIDPSSTAVVFADIERESRIKSEEEVLFSLNTVFKIEFVGFDSELNIWKIKLITTNEGTEKIQEYIKSIEQRLDEYPPIIYFGRLLIKDLGQINRAEKYFEMLLKTLPSNHEHISAVYNQIGNIHDRRGNLNLALKYFELAYQTGQKQLTQNFQHFAGSLNNIGRIHRNKGNFNQALNYYNQALDIETKYCSDDHIHKAVLIESIAVIYADNNHFEKAFNLMDESLKMLRRLLPAQHHYIALSLNYYYQLLEMNEQCLPSDHPELSTNLNMIIEIYKKIGQTEKALNFCRTTLDKQRKTLGDIHSSIAETLISMGNILIEEKVNESFNYFKEALSILEQLRSSDTLLISQCLTWISCIYWKRNMIDDALQNQLRALNLNCQKLSNDHPKIANNLRNIGIFYRQINDLSGALRYFNESLSIYQVYYRSDHEDVRRIQKDIAELNKDFVLNMVTDSTILQYTKEKIPRTLVTTVINDCRRPYIIMYTIELHNIKL